MSVPSESQTQIILICPNFIAHTYYSLPPLDCLFQVTSKPSSHSQGNLRSCWRRVVASYIESQQVHEVLPLRCNTSPESRIDLNNGFRVHSVFFVVLSLSFQCESWNSLSCWYQVIFVLVTVIMETISPVSVRCSFTLPLFTRRSLCPFLSSLLWSISLYAEGKIL